MTSYHIIFIIILFIDYSLTTDFTN